MSKQSLKRDNCQLARIAIEESKKFYHGNMPGVSSNLHPLIECFPFPNTETLDNWDYVWCGAFVYHCVRLFDYDLPVHYPDKRISGNFAGVLSWMQWAKLPEVNKWVDAKEEPMLGDIVLLQQFCNIDFPDHMGIVTDISQEFLEDAEGNFNNMTAMVKRDYKNVFGYIRL
ncbi:hypothetical protein LJC58_08515 [Lachnospiraceae bacterium OttesenSCG-928-D06]|nr:hypothetical protein [Lachnospiraceae bacterium OttesenSCG-928-D06]